MRLHRTDKRAREAPAGRLWAIAALSATIVTGCAAPRRIAEPKVSPDRLGSTAFVHYLAETPVVTVDEGGRAALLLAGHDTADASDRWALLRSRGMVRSSWKLSPDSVLDHGTFAFMLCRALDIEPDLNARLAGLFGIGRRRAAMRTAVYEGLLDPASAHDPITGGTVAAALARAESWSAR